MRHNYSTFLLMTLLPGLMCALPKAFGGEEGATRTVVVIAHRGDHTRAHENSLDAINNAVRTGVDYVELDVRRTRDGEYVLLHDSTVNRTTEGTGKLADLSWDEVRALHLTNRQRPDLPPASIPTLDQALEAMRGRIGLYLDFKEGDRQAVAEKLREHHMVEATLVYDDLDQLVLWKRLQPKLRTIATVGKMPDAIAGWRQLKESRSLDILDGPATDYTRENVDSAMQAGLLVWPDAEGRGESPALWESSVKLGVGGLMTDQPAELLSFLRARKLHR